MNTATHSDWQWLAHLRWPKADIHGDGPWAFLISCYENRGARLFATEQEARAEAGKNCGHAFCYIGHHSVVRLKPMLDRFPD